MLHRDDSDKICRNCGKQYGYHYGKDCYEQVRVVVSGNPNKRRKLCRRNTRQLRR